MKFIHSDIDPAFFCDRPLVILQSEIPESVVNCVIEQATKHGCPVLLNNAPARDIRPDILRQVTYLMVNETEATFMSGITVNDVASAQRVADQLTDKIRGTVIVTLGENGAVVKSARLSGHFPACYCDKVVDTTGAGDSFIGALAYNLVHNVPMPEAISFACKASAHSIQRYGGQSSFPTLDDLNMHV